MTDKRLDELASAGTLTGSELLYTVQSGGDKKLAISALSSFIGAAYVAKSAYASAHSVLVQQSGTGSPSSLAITENTLLGRLSGAIAPLSIDDVRTLLSITNIDNTSDADKPVSTATADALATKEPTIDGGLVSDYWRGDKTWQPLNKESVGLGNVDNTADVDKPISDATATALSAKYDASNPAAYVNAAGASAAAPVQSVAGQTGAVTLAKGDVGLGNVDNTSDVDKPVSTAQATAISAKQDTLVSGTNIKTINGSTILGAGDLAIGDPWTYVILGADVDNTTTTPANVTGLSFTPAANKRYDVEVRLIVRTSIATTGVQAGFNFPTGMSTAAMIQYAATGAAAATVRSYGNANDRVLATAMANNTQNWLQMASGVLIAGASPSGDFQVTVTSEIAATTATVKAGSFIKYREY